MRRTAFGAIGEIGTPEKEGWLGLDRKKNKHQNTGPLLFMWVNPPMTHEFTSHYNDVIMGAMACQIASLVIVYSSVYSGADQRKYQSSASLAFVRGIHRDRWIPRTKGQ